MFQFHIGAIRSWGAWQVVASGALAFQFHIGAIRREAVDLSVSWIPCFNSILVQLEVKFTDMGTALQLRFNSILVQLEDCYTLSYLRRGL